MHQRHAHCCSISACIEGHSCCYSIPACTEGHSHYYSISSCTKAAHFAPASIAPTPTPITQAAQNDPLSLIGLYRWPSSLLLLGLRLRLLSLLHLLFASQTTIRYTPIAAPDVLLIALLTLKVTCSRRRRLIASRTAILSTPIAAPDVLPIA
ncbi:hypothetical protein ACLOJK_029609 [Asimina triloba]